MILKGDSVARGGMRAVRSLDSPKRLLEYGKLKYKQYALCLTKGGECDLSRLQGREVPRSQVSEQSYKTEA